MHFCLAVEKDMNSELPQINNRLFNIKGIRADYKIVKVPNEKQAKILDMTHGFDGFNVGTPYKGVMGNYLDILCPRAKASGSVDTVVQKGLNFAGYNTDSVSFIKAVEYLGLRLDGNIAIIGHSPFAISLAIEAAERGAAITFLTQDFSKGLRAVNMVSEKYRGIDVSHAPFISTLKENTLLINGSSRLEFGHVEEKILTGENLEKIRGFFETDFALHNSDLHKKLARAGIPCSDGLRMMIEKAAASHNIWIGTKYDHDELDSAYLKMRFELNLI